MRNNRTSGKIIGILLLVAAIAAVFFFKPKKGEPVQDTTVRPIKSVVIGETFKKPELFFPGLVGADQKVDLSFNVAGQIVNLPPSKGQAVKKGDLLAQLDDTNFINQLDNAQAELTRAEATFKRMEKALQSNAISKEEFSKAQADFNKAKAGLEICKKNLEDTRILARFDGVIADIYVDKFDTISPGAAIIALQNNALVNITVSIPEQYLIHKRSERDKAENSGYYAIFDALPERKFDLSIKEYSTQADFKTQTYTVSFQMKTPDDLNILPGMSATVVIGKLPNERTEPETALAVESDYVGIDSEGRHFVWILEETAQAGIYTTIRRPVKVGSRSGTTLQLLDGLSKGERIAAAGISILTEGRRVSLLEAAKNTTAKEG